MTHVLFLEMNETGSGAAYLAAATRQDFETTFVTDDPGCYCRPGETVATSALAEVDHLLVADTHGDLEALWAVVAEHAHRHPVDAVLASMDLELPHAAELARRLGVPGTAPEAVRICRDKSRTRQALARAGVPSAAHAVANDVDTAAAAAARLGYPCVLKPLEGGGSEGVMLIRDQAELRQAVRHHQACLEFWRGTTRSPAVLLEQRLVGPLVSVESVSTPAGLIVLGLSDRSLGPEPHFTELRVGFPACRPDVAAIVAVAERALDAVGYDFGPAHTELIVSADGPRIVEINPRLIGSSTSLVMNASLGIDLHANLLRLHAGLDYSFAPTAHRFGHDHDLVAPRSGRLEAVEGAADLAACDGVIAWRLDKRPGDWVSAAPVHNIDTLGNLAVVGDDPEQARERLGQALAQLTIVVAGHREHPPMFCPAPLTASQDRAPDP